MDKCPGTVLPESVPTVSLRRWHYAQLDTDSPFEVNFRGTIQDSLLYNLDNTYGCTCEQILDCKPGQNKGEYKYGCTIGTMAVWKNQKAWALSCQSCTGSSCTIGEGEDKDAYENTDEDTAVDPIDYDNDNDGVPDEDDSEPDSEGNTDVDDSDDDENTAKDKKKWGKGAPDWWCDKHPNKC
jgi:hypothetical protein